jgi:acetyl esterase/lipase
VLDWLAGREHPRKVIIAGESAGAGLAASAAIMNRDRSGPALALQLLFYPALDHRLDTASARQPMPAQFGSRAALEKAWSIYLGGKSPDCYAAAACAEDLTALPPAHLAVGALDLLHDECVAYADRLERAGVAVELQVYDGAPHGFDHIAPDATVSKRAHANAERAIRNALAQ